ncbi:hypothetical protein D3C85_1810130 [compost metagenome]
MPVVLEQGGFGIAGGIEYLVTGVIQLGQVGYIAIGTGLVEGIMAFVFIGVSFTRVVVAFSPLATRQQHIDKLVARG